MCLGRGNICDGGASIFQIVIDQIFFEMRWVGTLVLKKRGNNSLLGGIKVSGKKKKLKPPFRATILVFICVLRFMLSIYVS